MKRILSAFMALICFAALTGAAFAEDTGDATNENTNETVTDTVGGTDNEAASDTTDGTDNENASDTADGEEAEVSEDTEDDSGNSPLTEKQSETVALLNAIGVLPDISDEQALEQITRADFAEIVVNMLGGADELTSAPRRIYTDVLPEDPAAPSIEYLYDKGIMIGYENAEFRPQNPITVSEVLKVMIVITGYSVYAEQSGGYPDGYYAQAVASDMLSGVSGKIAESITWVDIAEIARNVLESSDYVRIAEINGNGTTYTSENGEEFMSRTLGIYRYTGVVEGVGDTMLSGSGDSCGDGNCVIGGDTLLTGDVDVMQYLGMKVQVYYLADEYNGYTALHIIPSRDNDVLTIDDSDISKAATMSSVQYYDNNRMKTARISNDALFMFNGKRLDVVSDEDIKVGNGSLKLISNDNDSSYDIVIITSYETYIVDKAVSADCIVNLKYGKGSFDLDDDYVTTYYLDGEKVDFSSITSGSVLSIAFSRNTAGDVLADVYISNNQVTGVAVKVSNGEDGSVELEDGNRYEYTDEFIRRIEEGESSTYTPELNAEGTFYIDYFGKLAAYTLSVSSKNYAYVVKCWYDDITEKGAIRLFTKDGEFKDLDITSDVRINGDKTDKSRIVPILEETGEVNSEGEKTVNQLVVYSNREDGTLSSLQTAVDKTSENYYIAAENEFVLSAHPINANTGEPGGIRFYKGNAENRPLSFIDGSTIHFSIPTDKSREKSYKVETKLSTTDVSLPAPVYVYDAGNGGAIGAVVSNTESSSDLGTPVIVDKVLEAVNDEGDPGRIIQFVGGQSVFAGEEVTYTQPEGNWNSIVDYSNVTIDDLQRGDVIQYTTANDQVDQLRVLVRVNDIGGIRIDGENIAESGNMIADVISVSSNGRTALIKYVNNTGSTIYQTMLVNGTTYRYDSSSGQVYNSSSSDLQEGDRVLINSFWWSPKLVVIFR